MKTGRSSGLLEVDDFVIKGLKQPMLRATTSRAPRSAASALERPKGLDSSQAPGLHLPSRASAHAPLLHYSTNGIYIYRPHMYIYLYMLIHVISSKPVL